MKASETIRERRSIKRFTPRQLSREEILALLELAVHAPNHRLTNPWRFYVLGPDSRQAYGLALGARKARKLTDPLAAETLRNTVAAEHRALPAMIAVAVVESSDAEQREEDYAAAMMAIQNLMLGAVEAGLGTAIKTGAIMADPAARAAVGVGDDQRIIAVINLGEPADVPPPNPRTPAASLTTFPP